MSSLAPSATRIPIERAMRRLWLATRCRTTEAVGWTFLLGVPLLAPAQNLRPERAAIRLEQVVAALDLAKLPFAGAEVRLMAQNTATTDAPRLEVRGVEPWGDRDARVRMGCEAHEQCLPFYVAVHWVDATLAQAALHSAVLPPARSSRSAAAQSADPSRSASHEPARVISPAATRSADPTLGAETNVHAGSHATLLIDGERLHIKLPVICLESGVAGRTIRVTALDHKQTYRAEVVDSTLLKGTL